MEYQPGYKMFVLVLFFLLLCACTKTATTVIPPKVSAPPLFPPQKAMKTGDYAGFLEENKKALKGCGGGGSEKEGGCDVALFNLGFAHAYPKSPYYNRAKALRYFDELTRKYPESPWAFQARAWTDLLKKVGSEEKKGRRLQGELKSKDAAITGLQEQIKRSRDIDIRIENKERQILK